MMKIIKQFTFCFFSFLAFGSFAQTQSSKVISPNSSPYKIKQKKKNATRDSGKISVPKSSNKQNNSDFEQKYTKPESSILVLDQAVVDLGSNQVSEINVDELISGVREMLLIACDRTQKTLSVKDGFYLDSTIKIHIPSGSAKTTQVLQRLGQNKLVKDVELSMNRAAELATIEGVNEIKKHINEIDFLTTSSILSSGDSGLTHYLRIQSYDVIENRIRPIVEIALQKSNATKYWTDLFKNYNKYTKDKVTPDLNKYVCEKIMYAFFLKIGNMEKQIWMKPDDEVQKIIKRINYRP